MRDTGSVALIVVPIIANGRFYGILNVSAVERPERLEPTRALLDRLAGVVAQASIALENERLIESIVHQARHDNLTGLLAHRAFHEALEDLMRDRPADRPFTLATIDIDDFKLVNDVHGHPVGDKALRKVADALTRATREGDVVYRVGGEEFAVLIPGLAACEALPVADRLRAAVAQTPFEVPLRVSVGVASWPADGEDAETLIERADAALYAAKRAGKDRTTAACDAAALASADPSAHAILLDAVRRLRGTRLDPEVVTALEDALSASEQRSGSVTPLRARRVA